ncbi:hypothetical protein ARTSIC4J27_3894 [Pseudarthrobacter siccitolerans]|uniref:Uncharacterized protein n=1 Tax=Pseudarthrobacter siccitolerans TaxID=861266 RepID=A0A024H7M7_9MICC|nr:hypothetical protein ARTSIC4J27_3894 [Pseudarthrobacter siccitolerans]
MNLRDPGGGEDILGHGATFAAGGTARALFGHCAPKRCGPAGKRTGGKPSSSLSQRGKSPEVRLTPPKPPVQSLEMRAHYRDRMMTLRSASRGAPTSLRVSMSGRDMSGSERN